MLDDQQAQFDSAMARLRDERRANQDAVAALQAALEEQQQQRRQQQQQAVEPVDGRSTANVSEVWYMCGYCSTCTPICCSVA